MNYYNLKEKTSYLNKEGSFLVKKSFQFAEKAHQNMKRKTGEPYIIHPLNVAIKLADLKMDAETISAALLHDTLEDTKTIFDDLQKEFGQKIAEMVESVSKLKQVKYKTKKDSIENKRQIETLRKMFVAMAKDIRIILIKLADRWHNMETLSALESESQKRIAQETLEIYAPLAHRLGMGELKGILEDLAFPYAYPEEHNKISKTAISEYEKRNKYAKNIANMIRKELKQDHIKAEVHCRAKHLFSLNKKLKKYDMDMNKIYDLIALRIIVSDVKQCYQVLGMIHKKWKPLLGRIKDYIAIPKPNGYQSLHTTVFCEKGEIVEFQIRTYKMHREAEYGVAAHWHYTDISEPKHFRNGLILDEKNSKARAEELEWVKELAKRQQELKNSQDFFEDLKIDVFKDRIFVFTPEGDVVDLPDSASPIDFAYHIHSDIGNHLYGAKVNGKMVPLHHALQNGDIVEIITAKNVKPNLDWLKYVKTARAKERIKNFCYKQKTRI